MSKILTVQLPDKCDRIALCGGPYSNFAAVEAFLSETKAIAHRFCLGDMGGFGPFPNRTLDLVRQAGLVCLQGNYDDAVGNGLRDCGCGYDDPRDRQFAQISYDYTYANTSEPHRAWLRSLPEQILLQWRNHKILLCHGSPDQVNEFVWESESDDDKLLGYLERYGVEGICATHSGLPWLRSLQHPGDRPGFWFNVGVLGRPANHGKPHVNYGLISLSEAGLRPQLMSLHYDVQATVAAMREAELPEEFSASLVSGVWTTCAAILPAAERRAGAALVESVTETQPVEILSTRT